MTNIAVFCAEESSDSADGSMERNNKPGQGLMRAPLCLIVDGVCLFKFCAFVSRLSLDQRLRQLLPGFVGLPGR